MSTESATLKRRVLIIHDNFDAALLLSMLISAHGHNTAVANSGMEGLLLAKSFQPEIVFLDLGMPQMDGYEVAVALRAEPGLAKIYISALTGWNDAETRTRVVAAGFDKHLTKPANVGAVLQLVHDLPF
ncbi:response regulator [Massilia jejuensis]|uniref:Response regulator n=1 Tax=Massilia jejuensis TaxID=648894 RepID=A0ABW0PLI8_9BURK